LLELEKMAQSWVKKGQSVANRRPKERQGGQEPVIFGVLVFLPSRVHLTLEGGDFGRRVNRQKVRGDGPALLIFGKRVALTTREDPSKRGEK